MYYIYKYITELLCYTPDTNTTLWINYSGALSHIWLFCNPTDCSLPGSFVPGIFQVRILEWVAIPSFRGSSPPRNGTLISGVSCISRQVLYHWATWEAQVNFTSIKKKKRKNLTWIQEVLDFAEPRSHLRCLLKMQTPRLHVLGIQPQCLWAGASRVEARCPSAHCSDSPLCLGPGFSGGSGMACGGKCCFKWWLGCLQPQHCRP